MTNRRPPRAPAPAWIAAAVLITGSAGASPQGPTGRWLGQDGRDKVGAASRLGPSGIQDVAIAIDGLPAGRAIDRITIEGHGADRWTFGGEPGPYAAEVVREPGSTRAVVLFEPHRPETGREFAVSIVYDDGTTALLYLQGGKADPNLRMPGASLQARWGGLDDRDRTGPGPSVGPDGHRDVRIDLERIAADQEVRGVRLGGPVGLRWSFGPNPDGDRLAEFLRDDRDRSRGSLLFSPDARMDGGRLSVLLTYANGTTDRAEVTAGTVPADAPTVVPPAPPIAMVDLDVRWIGQADRSIGRGAVRVEVGGVRGRPIAAAVLTDGVDGSWAFERPGVPDRVRSLLSGVGTARRPLELREGDRAGTLLVDFVPVRDEEGRTLTLRLIDNAGASVVGRFDGASCDPAETAEPPAASTVAIGPADDLRAAVGQGGTIRLAAGTYRLDRPLVLDRPCRIVGEDGAELRFRQGEGSDPWAEAVAIRGGGLTTLSGLRIRFDGTVRWEADAPWGAAIVGLPVLERPKGPIRVVLEDLDLEAPPAATDWEPAPLCARLFEVDSGVIERNRLRGGSIFVTGGPWRLAENLHRGTMPNTFSGSMFSANWAVDLDVIDNVARPEPGAGKLYRFLVVAQKGTDVTIRGNTAEGLGPMDDDEHPHPNAPEILLTEAYRLRFEGRHAGVALDGLLLTIPEPQGTGPEPGDVVSVLSGSEAGRWVRVSQVIDRNHLLLDAPIADGPAVVAVGAGFVGFEAEANRIDCRGSTVANLIVLPGHHYGSRVAGNMLIGGHRAFELTAYPTEAPGRFGWSHTPFFDLRFEDNTIVDPAEGGLVAVWHGEAINANRGRRYLTAEILNNTFRWTDDGPAIGRDGPKALTIGAGPSLDPGELSLRMGSNTATAPDGRAVADPLTIVVGTVNGRTYGP